MGNEREDELAKSDTLNDEYDKQMDLHFSNILVSIIIVIKHYWFAESLDLWG